MAAEGPMDVLGLDHVDLTVNDFARSIPFYEKVLGALGFRRVPHAIYVVWANAHLVIGLRPAERDAAFDRYRVGLHHLALRVRSRDEVDRFHDLLVREGITVLDPPAEYPEYGPQYYAVFSSFIPSGSAIRPRARAARLSRARREQAGDGHSSLHVPRRDEGARRNETSPAPP